MLPPDGGGISGQRGASAEVGRHDLAQYGLVDHELESLRRCCVEKKDRKTCARPNTSEHEREHHPTKGLAM